MNLVAKLGLFATTISAVVFVQAQSSVNLASLLYTAPVKTPVERQEFRTEFEKADILGWLLSIQEYAIDINQVRTDSKFKMAIALELIAERASQIPITDRSLTNPTSPITVIEFYLSMAGPTAITAPVFKQFAVIQLGKECFLAATLLASDRLADERDMCVKQVFPVIVELSNSPSLLISAGAKRTLAMLAVVYPSPATAARSIAESDRKKAILDFEKRAVDALDALKDYQNTVDRR